MRCSGDRNKLGISGRQKYFHSKYCPQLLIIVSFNFGVIKFTSHDIIIIEGFLIMSFVNQFPISIIHDGFLINLVFLCPPIQDNLLINAVSTCRVRRDGSVEIIRFVAR